MTLTAKRATYTIGAMELLKRAWSAITGIKSPPDDPIDDAFESDITRKQSLSEIELVPTDDSDPYQDHTHRPHCSDHFLFTKDCALCQDVAKDRQEQSGPAHRSFGFTDNITAASLTPDLKNLGPTPANAALQSVP